MSSTSFSEIRRIDNSRSAPIVTVLAVAFLIFISVWFMRGESFRLYASLFFGLYHLTQSSWLSIILVSVVQNIFFLPLRIISERFYVDIKDFEHELSKVHHDDQYFVLKKQIRSGNLSVIFYIINFVLLFIAFISAGRVFFLEFYHTPIARHWLYDWIPYPEYPLQGVTFYFPFFRITSHLALDWSTIAKIWGYPLLTLVAIRLLWLLLKPLLSKNQKLLQTRIGINRFRLLLGGFIGTIFFLSLYFFRHLPTGIEYHLLSADLSKQNTVFNIITAVCTAFATIYSGVQHNKEATLEARKRQIPEEIIDKVNRQYLRQSINNALLLGVSALWVTRLMPCSHDLSVLAFEALYLTSPITFDLLIPKKREPPVPITASNP